jgi:DNA (cytosine-5)-methyltransferase 1
LFAGAGGTALGLEAAGFRHVMLVESDRDSAQTLRLNRPSWEVVECDIRDLSGIRFAADLVAAGLPSDAFSIAGRQDDQGASDLVAALFRIVEEVAPRAIMIDNVRGLASRKFVNFRQQLTSLLGELGYQCDWQLLYASSFGVPQVRPRLILVGILADAFQRFDWPVPSMAPLTIGESIVHLMAKGGWNGATDWARHADGLAPTIVGGSKNHGGPDLGPTRAKAAWLALGVDGRGIADFAPDQDAPIGLVPKLTNEMVARVQGFPADWNFQGKKTSVYRQIANALPPPLARAIGESVSRAIGEDTRSYDGSPLNCSGSPIEDCCG